MLKTHSAPVSKSLEMGAISNEYYLLTYYMIQSVRSELPKMARTTIQLTIYILGHSKKKCFVSCGEGQKNWVGN